MRYGYVAIYLVLAAALGVCSFVARRSGRAIGPSVAALLAALIPPVVGNLIIIGFKNPSVSVIGCYIYYLGMDLVMYALMQFTFQYCHLSWPNRGIKLFVYGLLLADAVQLLLNPVFGHAFRTETVLYQGEQFLKMQPLAGQTFHRIVDYGLLFVSMAIFAWKSIRSPKFYSERYTGVLIAMVLGTVWESYYVFSRIPVDRSMIGFAGFGLLIFYFSLYYRPFRLLDRMLANIAEGMPEAIFFYDAGGTCIWANQAGLAMTGLKKQTIEQADERVQPLVGADFRKMEDWEGRRQTGEGENRRYYVLKNRVLKDRKGRVDGSVLSVRDETEEQTDLQKQRYIARHDALTGLYMKEYLYDQIRARLAERPDQKSVVVFLNVNDFKIVNDVFGNEFGDQALQQVARWLQKVMPRDALYGRLGGDTFGVFLPREEFNEAAIEDSLTHFTVGTEGKQHPVLIHLGVYEVAEHGLDPSIMFDRARLALATIKEEYQTHIAWYDDQMREKVLWEQHISNQLEEAIAQRQIRPYLQPLVDQEGKVVGAEALVRWIHPTHGFLSPARFIPVFEKNGMIAEVDRYMWRCACEILASWKETFPDLFISVNISPKDFYFMDVAAEIKKVVAEHGIEPSKLRVEITETVMMTDLEKRLGILNDLKEMGFLVEMDDFGSGYSSLNLLKDMPVDVIKIDMMFLRKTKNRSRADLILQGVMEMSKNLGLPTITEGVETQDQYRMLRDMGCKVFQGYYFAKPMPVEEFEEKYSPAA